MKLKVENSTMKIKNSEIGKVRGRSKGIGAVGPSTNARLARTENQKIESKNQVGLAERDRTKNREREIVQSRENAMRA